MKIKKECKRNLVKDNQNLSREWKEKKKQYGWKRYKNLSEAEEQKLVEYRKKYYRMRKNALKKLISLKNNDLESPFDEEYKDILKN